MMDVKIVATESRKIVRASIRRANESDIQLPSLNEGWRFNFRKHSKKKQFQTYVLTRIETPDIVEGCLIFEMRGEIEPYMAYVEIAPKNRGINGEYDKVAGCLIAYVCRLSFVNGKGDYHGWLAFDVLEESKADEIRLMSIYSLKYKALIFSESTTMVISPEGGELLIEEFLT
jgi:hypothetical protein